MGGEDEVRVGQLPGRQWGHDTVGNQSGCQRFVFSKLQGPCGARGNAGRRPSPLEFILAKIAFGHLSDGRIELGG